MFIDDIEFLDHYWSMFRNRFIAMGMSATLSVVGVAYVLDNYNYENMYEIVVTDDNAIVISDSNIVDKELNGDKCVIKLYNGMEFEVPADKIYSLKNTENKEDVEKYVYSLVGEDANISYYTKEDVKKKVKTR